MSGHTHEILKLQGMLKHSEAKRNGMVNSLKDNQTIDYSHLINLAKDLEQVLDEWNSEILSNKILVTTDYCEVVAKSNRMRTLLKPKGELDLSELVKGARFEVSPGENNPHHVVTYLLPREAVQSAIYSLKNAASILNNYLGGSVNGRLLKECKTDFLKSYGFTQSGFAALLKDAWYVRGFRIAKANPAFNGKSLVSLYRIGSQADLINVLHRMEIKVTPEDFLNEDTLILNDQQRELLGDKAGWLIAMEVQDLMRFDYESLELSGPNDPTWLPEPTNEPVVGVIDTRFNKDVFFSKWVEYHDLIPDTIEPVYEDYSHGTSVCSIVVNGANINPDYDDGCGYFRVRHFGVATHQAVSTFDLLRRIQKIVRENQDIKVWNLSLGSSLPVDENFISPEAAELDRLQKQYDVLFIVAATNDGKTPGNGPLTEKSIGAPADSVNSIVVGAADRKGRPAPYTRRGPVLNFFVKPDLAAFGGTQEDHLFVCTPCGREPKVGTSYAAPWVTRKAAYLIHYLQMSRTEAKALLIDAAIGWKKNDSNWPWLGRGVLPQRIEDITNVPKDEIRFVISGFCTDYETFTYDLPIPVNRQGKYDYSVRATLCYFPECRRDQGVDYPLTELDLHFGRVDLQDGRTKIKSIDRNLQKDELTHFLPEQFIRSAFRKWDNVKVLSYSCMREYKVFENAQTWGFQIYTSERLRAKYGRGLPFTLVVTLKSKEGEDRTTDFIKACQAKGWIVNNVNVETHLKIAAQLEEEINLLE